MATIPYIPEKLLVTFKNEKDREGESIKLGFMSPHGEDVAALNRRSTQFRWAYSKCKYDINSLVVEDIEDSLQPKVYENTLEEFSLSKLVRRISWNSGNCFWRVQDPRGFELEISSANLARIISSVGIKNGKILDKCIWGRIGSENILVPESSDLYKEMVAATERKNTTVSFKKIKIGDKIELKSGVIGIYCGTFFAYYINYNKKKISSVKVKVLMDSGNFIAAKEFKVSKILEAQAKTDISYQAQVNEYIKNNKIYYKYIPLMLFSQTPANAIFSLTSIPTEEVQPVYNNDTLVSFSAQTTDSLYVKVNSNVYRIRNGWLKSRLEICPVLISTDEISNVHEG